MKKYSYKDKEIVLRPIIWLIINVTVYILGAGIGIAVAYFLKFFVVSSILRWGIAIILATGVIVVIFKIINVYSEDLNLKR